MYHEKALPFEERKFDRLRRDLNLHELQFRFFLIIRCISLAPSVWRMLNQPRRARPLRHIHLTVCKRDPEPPKFTALLRTRQHQFFSSCTSCGRYCPILGFLPLASTGIQTGEQLMYVSRHSNLTYFQRMGKPSSSVFRDFGNTHVFHVLGACLVFDAVI